MSLRSEVIRIINEVLGNSKKISELPAAGAIAGADLLEVVQSGANVKATMTQVATFTGSGSVKVIQLAASDETTALTTGTKITFRMPYAMALTSVRASLTTAQTAGSILTINITENGVTILSTKITIDNNEKTSTTAQTPAVISDAALADDAEVSVIIDQVGTSPTGLKITLIGT